MRPMRMITAVMRPFKRGERCNAVVLLGVQVSELEQATRIRAGETGMAVS